MSNDFSDPVPEGNPGFVAFTLGKVDGKLDLILAAQTKAEERISSVETRVRGLEQWQARVLGMSAVIATGCSYLVHRFGAF